MTRPRRWRLVVAVLVVAAIGTGVVGWRQRDDALAARDRARTASRADQRAAEEVEAQIIRVEAFIDDNRRIVERDRAGAERIDTAIADLAALQARLDEAQTAIVGLSTLSGEQVRQIGILRACVETLDAARAVLVEGSPAASALLLEQGRESCRQAEELAHGIVSAVHPFDFPDPAVLVVDGTYYAFATNGPAGTVQVLTSTDLADWSIRGSALESVASWARPGYTWAPSVIRTAGGGYVLYYAVRDKASDLQCISVATATAPQGPYVDRTTTPLLCHESEGGAIDASPFRDEHGNLFLTWKSEGETIDRTAQIWVQPLDPTGTQRTWLPVPLLRADRPWEGRTMEAPSMVRVGSTWLLLYSGNAWSTDRYAIGYATCLGPLGPCAKPDGNVLMQTNDQVAGPGGAEVFATASGQLRIAYAAWDPAGIGPPNPRRMHIATLQLTPEGPVLSD